MFVIFELISYFLAFSCGADTDWWPFSGNCYYVSDGENKKTWYQARDYCMLKGGDLASIHSNEENTQILRLVSAIEMLKKLCATVTKLPKGNNKH